MSSLNGSGDESVGGCSFLDKEKVKMCNKQGEGGERVEHES